MAFAGKFRNALIKLCLILIGKAKDCAFLRKSGGNPSADDAASARYDNFFAFEFILEIHE